MLALLLAALAPAAEPLPPHAKHRLGSTRLRHGGLVRALAFSPDGKTLASASHDQTVSVWEVPDGKERCRCAGHDADVLSVAFSPDGKLLASGGADGSARLWDASTGKELHAFPCSADSIDAVVFSPDGKVLAVGSDRGDLILFDVAARKESKRASHDRAVRCLAWSGDGKRLASSGDVMRPIVVYDADTLKPLTGFGSDVVQCLAFAPDGRRLASREAGGIFRIWDAERGMQVVTWQGEPDDGGASAATYQIAFTPDGKDVVAGALSGAVEVWDAATGKPRALLRGRHRDRVTALAVSSGGRIASGGADNAIYLWEKGAPITPSTEIGGPVLTMALSAKGTRLAAVVSGQVESFDRATAKAIASPARSNAVAYLGETLYFCAGEKLESWGADNPGSAVRETVPMPLTAIAAGGKSLATIQRDGAVSLHHANGKLDRPLAGKSLLMKPVLSPDGQWLAAVGREAPVSLWQTTTGLARPPLVGHRGGTTSGAFSPDGTLLATGGRDGFVRVWNLGTARQRGTGLRQDDWVTAVAWSSDGSTIAAGTRRGLVRLWDFKSMSHAFDLTAHRGPVTGLLFADDGKTLLSSSLDTTIVAWDVGGRSQK